MDEKNQGDAKEEKDDEKFWTLNTKRNLILILTFLVLPALIMRGVNSGMFSNMLVLGTSIVGIIILLAIIISYVMYKSGINWNSAKWPRWLGKTAIVVAASTLVFFGGKWLYKNIPTELKDFFCSNKQEIRNVKPQWETSPKETKQTDTNLSFGNVEEKQKGTLVWSKPKGVNGGNANLRNFSTEAVIERNDSEIMEFTSTYKYKGEVATTRFEGKREGNEMCGVWHQEYPQGGGEWCLKPKGNDNKVWEGMVSDGTGTKIPLELKLS